MTLHAVADGSVRGPLADHLLTPQNSALVVIGYPPSQVPTVTSIDHQLLTDNIVPVARLAKLFKLAIVLSTVTVGNGQGPLFLNPNLSYLTAKESVGLRSTRGKTRRSAAQLKPPVAKTDHDCAMDRGLPGGLPDPGRAQRRLRGVPGGGCGRGDVARGSSGRA